MKAKHNPRVFWTSVATFEELDEAEALRRFFEAAGFAARTQDERRLQRYWFWSAQHCGIHVQVPTESLELANDFLATNSKAMELMSAAVHCPSCHSSRIQYPQMTRRFILPTLVAQILVLLRFLERECYCEDCHHTWPQPSKGRSSTSPRSKHRVTRQPLSV